MDKIKCNKCNKKIGLIFFECKCTGKFCFSHRYCESHNCTYDFKSDYIDKLNKDNPKIVPQKVTII